MSLDQYHEKRNFKDTPEPLGAELEEEGDLRFVVQKHKASHLHYDFRLEADGVLKSWAVPKGPSLDPDDKRLAMMVEDHPMDYRMFEGVIPKGNYGAGSVMVWDEGTYIVPGAPQNRREQEKAVRYGLHKGHLAFVLHGQKLNGEFDLVKIHRGEENAWLLIKKKDEFTSTESVIDKNLSVVSGRTISEIAEQSTKTGEYWTSSAKPVELDFDDAPLAPMPRKVKPMLPTVVEDPFDRPGWYFEIKWDGYRAIAEVEKGSVTLYSRNLQPFNEQYGVVVRALRRLTNEVVLDGEIVVVDDAGIPNFELLQNYQPEGPGTLVYYVFDLLYADGHDLRKLPLSKRKELLTKVVPALPSVRISDYVENQGSIFFDAAVGRGLEGMVAKKAASVYETGRRSNLWLKVKAANTQDVVIAGFTAPKGAREEFGALILGVYSGNELTYCGHAGSGFDERKLETIRKKLEAYLADKCPFEEVPKTNAPVTWVRPELVCEVKFSEWTSAGIMRHPVFLRMRPDLQARDTRRTEIKPADANKLPGADSKETTVEMLPSREEESLGRKPKDVDGGVREGDEQEASDEEGRRKFRFVGGRPEEVEIDGHTVKLTNLGKIYWPKERYRKRDLVAYYREISDLIQPYLNDRPESMHRHPDGIEGESFFHKDVGNQSPDWVETITIESDDKRITYLLCQNEAALVYMANLGCIELNPWSSRVDSLDNPDFSIIDLDPLQISFEKVIEVAVTVRSVLEELGVESYPKTSGATGIHIYIPLGTRYGYDQSRQLAQMVCLLVNKRLPALTSLERSPDKRLNRVYLDFLQNRKGQTLAAPYSVRPVAGATVSTPLRWEEVGPKLDPSQFTIRTVPRRVQKTGDLWKPVVGKGIDMMQFLEAVQKL